MRGDHSRGAASRRGRLDLRDLPGTLTTGRALEQLTARLAAVPRLSVTTAVLVDEMLGLIDDVRRLTTRIDTLDRAAVRALKRQLAVVFYRLRSSELACETGVVMEAAA